MRFRAFLRRRYRLSVPLWQIWTRLARTSPRSPTRLTRRVRPLLLASRSPPPGGSLGALAAPSPAGGASEFVRLPPRRFRAPSPAEGTGTVSASVRTSTDARRPGPPNRARVPASTRSGPSSRPRIEGRARRTPPRTAHADGIAITAPSGAPRVRPPRRPGGPRRRPRRHRPRRRPPARSRPRRGPRRPRRRPHRSPHRSIQPAD